ncbi:MAG: spermidine synthase [Kiritimatiellae bacterium]|nr:spermidine synthase [Kiritimatiellia bacterium]MDD5519367.1 spermidine synthase [Kiritimatiellia bacterium]
MNTDEEKMRLRRTEELPNVAGGSEVLERAAGRSGELVLRRSGADLEVIAGGTFLISSANTASSVALITAGLPFLKDRDTSLRGIEVLIGGLGLGYALDAALAERRVVRVTVVEYEPVIVEWFRKYGEKRAELFAAGETTARARVLVNDVANVMRENPGAFDLIALDTDNGPDWLVRESNAGLYDEAGLALAHSALRPGGVAVFWSPERYDWFAARLATTFSQVNEVAAHDLIGGRSHEYTMYVAQREVD